MKDEDEQIKWQREVIVEELKDEFEKKRDMWEKVISEEWDSSED